MTDKTSKVILKYEVDRGSQAQVDQSVAQMEKRLNAVSKAQSDVNRTANQAGDAIRKAFQDPGDRALQRLLEERKAVEGTTAAIKEKIKQQRAAELAAGKTGDNRSVLLGGSSGSSQSGVLTESVGRGSTALGGIASVARGVGGQATGEALGFSGDVLGAVEGIAKLKGEMSGLVKTLPEAGGLTGKLASAIGGAGGLTVAAGLAAVAVAGVVLAYDNYLKITKEGNDALAGIVAGQREYFQLAKTGTTEQVQAKIKQLEDEKAINQQIAAENKNILDQTFNQLKVTFGPDAAKVMFEAAMKTQPALQAAQKAYDDSTKAVEGNNVQLGRYNGLLQSGATAANNAAEAEKKLNTERLKGIDRQMAAEIEYAELVKNGTSEQVKKVIESEKIKADAIANAYSKAIEAGDKESQEKAKQLKEQYDQVTNHIKDLQRLVPDLEAKEKAKGFFSDLLKGIGDGIKGPTDAIKKFGDAVNDAVGKSQQDQLDNLRTFLEEKDKADQEQQKRDEDLVNITKKYTEDRTKIETDALQARADINRQYADKLVNIAQDAANAAADNLTKLQQAREDITRSTVRDEEKAQRDAAVKALDIQINAAREDEKSARAHAQRMAQIRQDAQDREADMILNRDFLALFQSRRQTVNDLRNENTSFTSDSQERQIAAGQQMDDLRRQIANERNERLIAYQQQLQDAQITYQRDIEQASVARQRALQLAENERQNSLAILQQKTAQELAIRQAAAANEIRLSQMTSEQKTAIFRQELAQAQQLQASLTGALVNTINQARSALASASQRSALAGMLSRAGGGWLEAGQSSLVNDAYPGQRESFGGAQFPAGLGVFTPMRGGNVSANSASFANNWNIQGNDPQAIWQFIEPRLQQSILNTLGRL